MSNLHWKSTTVARPDLKSMLEPLVQVSLELDKVITFLDLEATTFMGRPNFGITEIGMLHVNGKGHIGTSGSFVNPEHSISKEVQILTGIRPEMLKSAYTWGDGWAQAMNHISQHHVVIGYNTSTFDLPAMKSQSLRYGKPKLDFKTHWDAMKIYRKAFNTNRGKLVEAAQKLGIDVSSFKGHRATEDAILTAQVFMALWHKFPHLRPIANASAPVATNNKTETASVNKTNAKKTTSRVPLVNREQLTRSVLVFYINKNTYAQEDLEALADVVEHQHPDREALKKTISFEISRLLDTGEIALLEPRDGAKKEMLAQEKWKSLLKDVWENKKRLAPVLEVVQQECTDINYIDLRWMLHYHCLRTGMAVCAANAISSCTL